MLKSKLEEEKSRITEELSQFAKKDPRVEGDWDTIFPQYGTHTSEQGENASETEEYHNLLSVEHSLESRLKDIGDALKKIEQETYGTCERCGNEIDVRRLEANPEARLCMNCHTTQSE